MQYSRHSLQTVFNPHPPVESVMIVFNNNNNNNIRFWAITTLHYKDYNTLPPNALVVTQQSPQLGNRLLAIHFLSKRDILDQ